MKVVLGTFLEYPHIGGVSTHLSQLEKGLKNAGFEVQVISRLSLSKWIIYVAKALAGVFYVAGKKDFGYLVYHWLVGYFLAQKINTFEADVIHLHSPTFAVYWLKRPYLLTCHADMVPEMVGQGKLNKFTWAHKQFEKMEVASYSKAKVVIAVDSRLKKFVSSVSPEVDIIEMKNFLDVFEVRNERPSENFLSVLEKINGRKIILCPRRLVVKNGVEVAIRMMLKLPDNFCLVIAGDGELMDLLQGLVKELGLHNKVFFLGSQSETEMNWLFKQVDLVIIPSITVNGLQEATSLAALEGFLFGKLVVASEIGGLKEMIEDGVTGILFPEGEYSIAADKILNAFSNPDSVAAVVNHAKKNLTDNFSIQSRVEILKNIYKDL